jgi:uncharacterized RDD family membrane protein YckC
MENSYQAPEVTENLLDDVEYTLYQAGSGKRFVNYLIDRVIVYCIYRLVLFKALVAILTQIYVYTESRVLLYILAYTMYATISALWLASFEALCKGKTPAKWITGTRAVNQDGTPISSKTAFLRSLSRLVPLEAFSALGSPSFPWHDSWTNTYVIDENLSSLPA